MKQNLIVVQPVKICVHVHMQIWSVHTVQRSKRLLFAVRYSDSEISTRLYPHTSFVPLADVWVVSHSAPAMSPMIAELGMKESRVTCRNFAKLSDLPCADANGELHVAKGGQIGLCDGRS